MADDAGGDERSGGPVEDAGDDERSGGTVEDAGGDERNGGPVGDAGGDERNGGPVGDAGDDERSGGTVGDAGDDERDRGTEPGAGDGQASAAPSTSPTDYEAYEVFVQWQRGEPHEHAETVDAPDAELALHLAKRNVDVRSEPVSIMVVPRSEVAETSPDDTTLVPSTDRSYRQVGWYARDDPGGS